MDAVLVVPGKQMETIGFGLALKSQLTKDRTSAPWTQRKEIVCVCVTAPYDILAIRLGAGFD